MSYSRLERLLALAWSLDDYRPGVKTATGQLRTGQRRSESAHHRELCATCDGTGETRDRFGRQPRSCPTCGGAGRFWVDGMTGERTLPPGRETSVVPMLVTRTRPVLCDRCGGKGTHGWDGPHERRCDLCDGAGRLHVPVVGTADPAERVQGPDPVLARLEARDRHGSWHQLELALDVLRHTDPAAWRAFLVAHVLAGQRARPGDPVLGRAYRQLAAAMTGRVRVPVEVLAAWDARFDRDRDRERRRLDRMGRAARRHRELEAKRRVLAGESPLEVARELGVSVRSVQRFAYHGTAA